MRTVSALVALASLLGAVVLVPVYGAALFVLLLFGLVFGALVGVLSGVEDRAVRQHEPSMDPTRWRSGS